MFCGAIEQSRANLVTGLLLSPILLLSVSCQGMASDWPCWRGPAQNGMAYEKAVVKSWTIDGENQLWKSPIGGRTTPVLMDGRLFFNTVAGEGECLGERVVCLDANTGKLVWEHKFNVYLTDIVAARVGWTAVVGDPETKYVYCHGTGGMFYCFDFDGNVVWRQSLTEMYNRVSGYGGRLHTPMVDEDRVVISFLSSNWGNHGKPGHRYVALDKRNGDVVWWSMPGGAPLDTTYSVPVTTVINGRRMLIAGNADGGVYGLEARTGRKMWGFMMSKRGLNTSTVMDGKYAYVTHSEENLNTTQMGSIVCLDASMTGDLNENDKGVVWRYDGITAGYASPAIANGRLYAVDNAGKLYCFDAKSGKRMWEHTIGRVGKGSPTVTADGVIYAATVNGRFSILKDEGDQCKQFDVKQFEATDDSAEIYGNPIVSGGRVYFMTRTNTFCLGAANAAAERVAMPDMPEEKKGATSAATTLLVIPGEVTLAPGEKLSFRPRLFDADGREIGATSATWTAPESLGTIQPDGTFTASAKKDFMAGLVEATIGKVKGTARVRVSPSLPIEVDFDSMPVGQNPAGWVGLGKKTQLTLLEGDNIVLQKLAPKEFPSAPFMRIEMYSGPPIAASYTVECDVMARPRAKGRPVVPDMGLINSRYFLKMLGGEQSLRLVTWSPVPRLRKDVPFEWETDVWYRTKLRVEVKDGKGMIRGKAWPRVKEEPEAWQVEMVDPCPNTEGSPGLYAYSHGTKANKDGPPIYFDNYRVYAND